MKKLVWALLSVFVFIAVLSVSAEARVPNFNWWAMKPVHHVKHVHHAHGKTGHAKHRKHVPPPPPIIVATIDIASQTMALKVNGWPYGYWRVSTARSGYTTPRGMFHGTRLAKVYYSKKYDNSPMPNSVFFYGGNAIHGTGHISQLGRPASHGCVRLHPNNAATFYDLVQKYGLLRTRIIII